jgi:subtilisin family serine protease
MSKYFNIYILFLTFKSKFMNYTFTLFIALMFCQFSLSQTPEADQMNFESNEIIVKLNDDVDVGLTYNSQGKALSDFNLKQLLNIEDQLLESSIMFDRQSIKSSVKFKQKRQQLAKSKQSKTPNTGAINDKPLSLKNIFKIKLDSQQNQTQLLQLIDDIKQHPDVEFVEPNYKMKIDDFEVGDVLTNDDVNNNSSNALSNLSQAPNDLLYGLQNSIAQTNIDNVWENYTTGDGSQVIAILDTGVDYNHPDLEDNIWVNEAELNGVDGFDDDGNGYVDDIYGWDFINEDNAPLDDNMHGTHVAGIAGAVGNNEIGIAGAAWDVKLMSIKVFQSNGVGNSTTIAEGVAYASNNGATILNMSFGGYAESSILRAALENAYASAFLVAAAGNDGKCIGPGECPDGTLGFPLYPGSYSYVLGVEDSPTPLANGYTNYDQDGSTFSGYSTLLNYEVKAPGTQIISTIPGGGYSNLTGTSMATPLVAGAMALYLEQKPEDSKELIFGNLINTAGNPYIDILAAIDVVPTPELQVLSITTRDTINNQNGNEFLEPGETIEVLPVVKNYWGPTDDVRVGIEFAELEDTSKATIVENEIQIGAISAYASLQDLEESLKIEIADNVANNVNIRFLISVWSGDNQEHLSSKEVVINVKNSILLSGFRDDDLTLTADKEYLVVDNFVMNTGTTLTIEPGVELYISANKSINIKGNVIANGTPTQKIKFLPEGSRWNEIILGNNAADAIKEFSFCEFYTGKNIDGNAEVSDCLFYDFEGVNGGILLNTNMLELNAFSSLSYTEYIGSQNTVAEGLNIINNKTVSDETIVLREGFLIDFSGFINNNIFNNWQNSPPPNIPLSFTVNNQDLTITNTNYYGSSDPETLQASVLDFIEDSNLGVADINAADAPSAQAHGIVWKVEVNGFDAQDEYDQLDPIGVGSHEFKVYFNREMDTVIDPQISYGPTIPYNQTVISEQGTWSDDGKIYTVTHDVNIGAADGINRIRVQDAKDLDNFVIPVEDSRFNMLVQSAGSASTGFFATPGLGKIDLDWEDPAEEDLTDILGYNMYRYQIDEDGLETELIKLNETLITETEFTDFEVEEQQSYFYKYKILRTSFEETDFSKTITAQPLTSELGDSNGDFDVNVLDVITDVDYILGQNPSPFISNAADVNSDQTINVLDIVGTVDLILNPNGDAGTDSATGEITYYPNTPIGDATLSWEGDDLFIDSEHLIGGIQLVVSEDFDFNFSPSVGNIEQLVYEQDGFKVIMLYSFNNQSFGDGPINLLSKLSNSDDIGFENAVVATTSGAKLNVIYEDNTLGTIEAPEQSNSLQFSKLYPNPSSGMVNLDYYLPQHVDRLVLTAYNLQGKVVFTRDNFRNVPGKSSQTLNVSDLSDGVYIMVLRALKNDNVIFQDFKKLIID